MWPTVVLDATSRLVVSLVASESGEGDGEAGDKLLVGSGGSEGDVVGVGASDRNAMAGADVSAVVLGTGG